MLLCLLIFSSCTQNEAPASSHADEAYSIVSVNIKKTPEKKVLSVFDSSPDIVCLQYSDELLIEKIVKENPGYTYYKQSSSDTATDKEVFSNAIFWKTDVLSPLKTNTVWMSDTMTKSSFFEGSDNFALLSYALLDGPFGSVAVFNADFDANNKTIRKKELYVAASRILCYTSYFPTVLTGDLPFDKENKNTVESALKLISFSNNLYYSSSNAIKASSNGKNGLTSVYLVPQSTPMSLNIDNKMIALTYDDGPSKLDYTERLISTLSAHNAKATFFVLGTRAELYKETLEKAFSIGCEIGNHTYNHDTFTSNTLPFIKSSLERTSLIVEDAIGVPPFLVRPPGGAYRTPSNEITRISSPIILWSVDTKDYEQGKTADDVFNFISEKAFDGAIVLMHDIHSPSIDSADRIITSLIKDGYQLVTVSELLEFSDVDLDNNFVYTSANSVYKN